MINKNLYIELLRVYAFQPAIGFWRAENACLLFLARKTATVK